MGSAGGTRGARWYCSSLSAEVYPCLFSRSRFFTTLLSLVILAAAGFVHFYPAILRFVDFKPWPEPTTLGEALLRERRLRGLRVDQIAAIIGADEGTWRR